MHIRRRSWRVRIGLSGSIGSDDGGKIRVAKKKLMVALVGLEVCALLAVGLLYACNLSILNNSRRMSFPMLSVRRGGCCRFIRCSLSRQVSRKRAEGSIVEFNPQGFYRII